MPVRQASLSQPFSDARGGGGGGRGAAGGARQLLQIPVVRAVAVLNLVLILLLALGRARFYRDPGSIFFDESHAYERRYSAVREEQGRLWIKKQQELYPEHYSRAGRRTPAENATVCAAFLTTVRPGVEPYLDNSIATFLDRMTPEERAQVHLSVFFATSEPFHHHTYHRTWLRKVVDEVYSYADVLSPTELEDVRELESLNNGLRKSPYDYTIPLRQCYENSKARYIAIFEDDVILAEGWFARTLLALREMELHMRRERRRGEWLYLRLFNQERSTGWVSSRIGGNQEHKYWAMFGIPIALFLLVVRRRSRRWRYWIDNQTIMVVTLVFTPIFVVLYFKAGKASLQPPAPGLREEDFGCCAQGLVFNRFHAEHLADYMLVRQRDGYHDNLLTDYARVFELARWSQYPMVMQHVGTKSSIQTDPLEAQRVWSMAFEDLEAPALARDHKDMLETLFGPAEADSQEGHSSETDGAAKRASPLDILRPAPRPRGFKRLTEVEFARAGALDIADDDDVGDDAEGLGEQLFEHGHEDTTADRDI